MLIVLKCQYEYMEVLIFICIFAYKFVMNNVIRITFK